jgi:outer membrane protein TolC
MFPLVTSRPLVGMTLALLCIAQAPASLAVEYTLNLPQAQQLALERSRSLAGQDMAVRSAREMSVAAGQRPDPVLKMGIENLPLSGADRYSLGRESMTMRRIGLMQELPGSDKLRLRAERFESSAQKSLAEKALLAAVIQRDSALVWLERYYAESMAKEIDAELAQATLEIAAAESAYRSGQGSQAEVLANHSALAMLEDRNDELTRKIANAKTMLIRWVGQQGDLALGKLPDLSQTTLADAEADLASQLERHPQLAVLARQEQFAHTEASLAMANRKADWSVEVNYQHRGPGYADMLSVGVAIPLQWDQGQRQDREVSAKMAVIEQARAEREEGLRALLAQAQSERDEWRSKRQRLARFESTVIPLAKQGSAAILAAYRGGKASLNQVLAARRNESEIRLQTLQLEAECARLWAQLQFLVPTSL